MKQTRSFTIREYGYLLDGGDIDDHNVVSIPRSAFKNLLDNIHHENDNSHIEPFIKLTSYNRKPALKVQNYVGVLRTPCGSQIEILPKLYNKSKSEDAIEAARYQLLEMLRTLRNSPFKQGGRADIRDARMPLLEVYITQFLSLVNQLVKRGVRSDYLRVQANVKYLKGRLLVSQEIRKNTFHKERFYIEYEEYQINRPANRLIKSALLLVSNLSRFYRNQRLARELSFVFEAVPVSKDIKADFMKVRIDRAMGYYSDVINWCRLLLNGYGLTATDGNFNTISLLYPMERIFEDYVTHSLRLNIGSYFPESCTLSTQVNKRSLVDNHIDKPIFNLRPDLLIQKEGENICVMDTKWKLIDSSDRSNKYGISQADMYQLYAYGHKYLRGAKEKRLMLIYPKTDTFCKPLPVFTYEDGFELEVVPFDISNKKLITCTRMKNAFIN